MKLSQAKTKTILIYFDMFKNPRFIVKLKNVYDIYKCYDFSSNDSYHFYDMSVKRILI